MKIHLARAKSVEEALKEVAKNAHLYPDDSYFELKEGLAKKFGVGSRNLIIGSGSDQINRVRAGTQKRTNKAAF